jgi:hypothetical protein
MVFLFFSFVWEEEDAKRKHLKQKGRSESQKWKGRVGAWRKTPSLLCIFSFFCLIRKRYHEKAFETEGQKREPKMKGQNESLKEGSLPSLHFFSSLWFLFIYLFIFRFLE